MNSDQWTVTFLAFVLLLLQIARSGNGLKSGFRNWYNTFQTSIGGQPSTFQQQ